jgi:homogentisate phytyltransferase / homogentisate geranylgeranyltransferase
MQQLKAFWQFCRPHTIFGSLFSVTTLYILACVGNVFLKESSLFITIIASLACNIFIVGLNQIIDVDLDKINKPKLPLAAGTMQMQTAKTIILVALFISIVFGFWGSYYLGMLILIINSIGYLYSAPPVQLKRHHLPAAISITLVRGLLVNLGMFIHFRYVLYAQTIKEPLPTFLLPLTLFIIAFSVAIAWFKDLPDTEGDKQFHFKTLSVLYSKNVALIGGSIMVVLAYLFCIGWSYVNAQLLLCISHIVLLLLFVINLLSLKLDHAKSIKNFYLRFWVLFFAEYIVFAVWAIIS